MKKLLPVFLLIMIFPVLSGQSKMEDKRDGNAYRTIIIGGSTWMAENLKYKAKSGAYFFDNDLNNIHGYGVLYDWETAKKSCPAGWHLPTGSEFQVLINYLDQKELSTFAIQLGGMQDYEGTFSELDESGYYWTSTEYGRENAEYFSYLLIDDKPVIDISRKEDIADIQGSEKSNKYSVRCLKN